MAAASAASVLLRPGMQRTTPAPRGQQRNCDQLDLELSSAAPPISGSKRGTARRRGHGPHHPAADLQRALQSDPRRCRARARSPRAAPRQSAVCLLDDQPVAGVNHRATEPRPGCARPDSLLSRHVADHSYAGHQRQAARAAGMAGSRSSSQRAPGVRIVDLAIAARWQFCNREMRRGLRMGRPSRTALSDAQPATASRSQDTARPIATTAFSNPVYHGSHGISSRLTASCY